MFFKSQSTLDITFFCSRIFIQHYPLKVDSWLTELQIGCLNFFLFCVSLGIWWQNRSFSLLISRTPHSFPSLCTHIFRHRTTEDLNSNFFFAASAFYCCHLCCCWIFSENNSHQKSGYHNNDVFQMLSHTSKLDDNWRQNISFHHS